MASIEPRVASRAAVERAYRREPTGQLAAHIPGYYKGLYPISPAPYTYGVGATTQPVGPLYFVPMPARDLPADAKLGSPRDQATDADQDYCFGHVGELYRVDDKEGLELVRPVVESIGDIDRLPDPAQFGAHLVTAEMRAEAAERKKTQWLIGGVPSADLTINWPNGIQRMMEWVGSEPELVAKYMDYTLRLCLAWLDVNAALGVDEIGLACCYGSASLLSPRMYRKLTDQVHVPLIQEAHRHGIKMKIHQCGNSRPNWQSIADQGFDAMETIDPLAGCTIPDAKRQIGDRVVLFGNVDTLTLATGTPADAIAETRRSLREGMPGGGFVLGLGDTTVSRATSLANLLAVRSTFEEYGWY